MLTEEFLSRKVLIGVTIENLLYVMLILAASVTANMLLRLLVSHLKTYHQKRRRIPLNVQIMADITEPLTLWIPVLALYLVALALPPLNSYRFVATQFFTVLSILLAISLSIRLQASLLTWYGARLGQRTAQSRIIRGLIPIGRVVTSLILLAAGMILILDQLNVAVGPLVAGLGIGGIAFAFALQGTLSNLLAGFSVVSEGSVRIGDYVELAGGPSGFVGEIGWRTTRVSTLANTEVLIPNSKLAESIAINYDHPSDEIAVLVDVGVSYASDLNHVERTTLQTATEVMLRVSHASEAFQPAMRYTAFGDSNISFRAVLWAKGYRETWAVRHEFIKALHQRFQEERIEIAFPTSNIYVRNAASQPPAAQLFQGDAGQASGETTRPSR